jgi:hypothetical protein
VFSSLPLEDKYPHREHKEKFYVNRKKIEGCKRYVRYGIQRAGFTLCTYSENLFYIYAVCQAEGNKQQTRWTFLFSSSSFLIGKSPNKQLSNNKNNEKGLLSIRVCDRK